MTQRTKNHLIEDESRLFFKKSLPPVWVCRDKTDDYGIDCEVEIFDADGNPTGLVFWIQLKGTNAHDSKSIKSKSFKKAKIIQYLNYDIPVLIVRYSSHKQMQYFKWARDIELDDKSAQNIIVQFFESEIWTESTSCELREYLQNQNFIKQGRVKLPVDSYIRKAESDDEQNIPYFNISIIKQCLNTKKQYFEIANKSAGAALQFKVGEDFIITTFNGLASAKMSLNFEDIESSHIDGLTKHILITFSQTLFDIGKNQIAEEIIFDNGLFTIIQRNKDYLISLLPYLLNGDKPSRVLEQLNEFFKTTEDDNLVAIATHIILIENRSSKDPKIINASEEYLKIQLTIAKERRNRRGIATGLYNLGNFYRSTNNLKDSLRCYLDARKYDENYKTQSYYYYELAGVLFLINRFRFSSSFYSRAIELNTDYPLAKALFAHSLIFSGEYQSALKQIDEFLIEQNGSDLDLDEWQLWYSCLSTLLNSGYPKNQKRDSKLAMQLTEKNEFEKATFCDMLHDISWFNLGVKEAKEKNMTSAHLAFTFSALLCNGDIEAWTNATLCALSNVGDLTLLVYTIRTSYHYNGYEYVANLRDQVKSQNPGQLNMIIELIDKIITPPKKETIIVRLHTSEGDYTKIDL